jgi:hypothetical protein
MEQNLNGTPWGFHEYVPKEDRLLCDQILRLGELKGGGKHTHTLQ